MTTVSSRVFSENPIHYLNLASRERVEVKRGKMIFQITPKPQFENPSPSGVHILQILKTLQNYNAGLKRLERGKPNL